MLLSLLAMVLSPLLRVGTNTRRGNACGKGQSHHLNNLQQYLVCHVCSRRQKRSKLKELNASCIWRITPTPSPSPERSASPVVNGDAARCAASCHLRLTCDTRLLTCLSGLLGSHCHHARLQLFRLRRTCHAVLLQEGEEAGGQGSRQQRQ